MTETRAFTIRQARTTDSAAILAIYAPFVETTAISFEATAPTVEEFETKVRKTIERWQWLVAEHEGQCLGYAYGSEHRTRAAYRWSVEVSVYVAPTAQRLGVGRALYSRLLDDLAARGYCNAYAGIAMPNEPSVALHRSMGFEFVGTFQRIGRKFGQWHDVAWYQRRLRDEPVNE